MEDIVKHIVDPSVQIAYYGLCKVAWICFAAIAISITWAIVMYNKR